MELILRNPLGVMEYLWAPASGKHFIQLTCPRLQPCWLGLYARSLSIFLWLQARLLATLWWDFSILLECPGIMEFFLHHQTPLYLAEFWCCPCEQNHSGSVVFKDENMFIKVVESCIHRLGGLVPCLTSSFYRQVPEGKVTGARGTSLAAGTCSALNYRMWSS